MAKQHDEREAEILTAARDLFSRQGYDQTPVQAIIDAVGIAKGTFYHYFASKDDLLDALVDRLTTEARDQIEKAVAAVQGGVADKLNALARLTSRWKWSCPDLMDMSELRKERKTCHGPDQPIRRSCGRSS